MHRLSALSYWPKKKRSKVLKEGVPMNDPSASIPFIQMLLSWTLLGVLLAWMLFFAFLAFRPQKAETRETASLPTPSGVCPTVVPRTLLRHSAVAIDVSRNHVPASAS